MRWINAYMRRHKVGIFMYLIFGAVFAVVIYLYQLHMEPAVYAIGLCLVIAVIVLMVDSVRYHKKVEELEWQLEAVKNGTEKLPEPEDEIEKIYQMLLENAQIERTRQVGEVIQEKAEVTDYFTLWTHQIKTPIAAMHLLLQQEMDTQGLPSAQEPYSEEGAAGNEWGTETEFLSIEQYYAQKREIEAELFKIEQYVDMVLQYLRLNSSIHDFVLQEYELDPIIRQAVRKYAPMFIRKNLTLHYTPLQVKAVTDEKWLVFVLEQILSNAIKYTSSGNIFIYMENGCLVIKDTGIGILPEDLPRVFDKGYTGYNGRSDKKASGIGLYLVQKILNKLGHKIMLESETGKGTKVRLLF